ncbi:MAG: hypothetical protein ACAI34_12530 [Verrucomicrobium sp.]
MNQPIPSVTEADVERVVRRDFQADQYAQVIAMLAEYGQEEWHRERGRVRLAALKLAKGKLDALRQSMNAAICNCRDVLAPAGYPAYERMEFRMDEPLSAEQQKLQKQLIEQDWQQYESWMYR